MRFITEFEIDGIIDTKLLPHLVPDKKAIRELGIGKEIGKAFGWEEKGVTTPNPKTPITHKYKLEIEAFPIDKWERLKSKMFHYLIQENISLKPFENMIKELESFGNQVTSK